MIFLYAFSPESEGDFFFCWEVFLERKNEEWWEEKKRTGSRSKITHWQKSILLIDVHEALLFIIITDSFLFYKRIAEEKRQVQDYCF